MYILVRKYGYINTTIETLEEFENLYSEQKPKPTRIEFIEFIIAEFSKSHKKTVVVEN